MYYNNCYIPLPTEDYYSLPQLGSVPPELEVPDLVIPGRPGNQVATSLAAQPSHFGKTSSKARSNKSNKSRPAQCPYEAAHYNLPSVEQEELDSAAPWRQSHANPPTPSPTANKKQWRRKRTVFTTEELATLTEYYDSNKFLNPALKAEILSKIEVPGNVLVMWYQNRRAKDRANGIVI